MLELINKFQTLRWFAGILAWALYGFAWVTDLVTQRNCLEGYLNSQVLLRCTRRIWSLVRVY
jgi:hypothetical protein